jgi:hypothetical protein
MGLIWRRKPICANHIAPSYKIWACAWKCKSSSSVFYLLENSHFMEQYCSSLFGVTAPLSMEAFSCPVFGCPAGYPSTLALISPQNLYTSKKFFCLMRGVFHWPCSLCESSDTCNDFDMFPPRTQ